jgi:hypothetical protein
MQLIFETDRKPMQWPHSLFVLGIVVVEKLGPLNSFVEKDLMQAVVLLYEQGPVSGLDFHLKREALYNLMCDSSSLAKPFVTCEADKLPSLIASTMGTLSRDMMDTSSLSRNCWMKWPVRSR